MSNSCDPWTVALHVPLSIGLSRQEYWSGLPFPSPGDLPDPGIEPGSAALQADSLSTELPRKPPRRVIYIYLGVNKGVNSFYFLINLLDNFFNGIVEYCYILRKPSFPEGSDGKESTWNAGDLGSIPRSGRSSGEGNGYPRQSQRVRHNWVTNTHFSLRKLGLFCNTC